MILGFAICFLAGWAFWCAEDPANDILTTPRQKKEKKK